MDDPFGAMLLDALEGRGSGHEIVERDDGFVDVPRIDYFARIRLWTPVERRAARFVRGRVLDVGCGAGRLALELQARGWTVVAIEPSSGAADVCRRRGVLDVRPLRLEDVDPSLGSFDTIAMYGNNFGLFGGRSKARKLLRRLRAYSDRIVATSVDPSATDDPIHIAYQERNRARGRLPGQLRLRVRYRDLAGPWFDYLLVSPTELEELLGGTAWQIDRLIRTEDPYYAVVLR